MDRYQLAAARGMMGWTLKELSAKTNITVEAINKFETGTIENPRKSTITTLKDVFENHGVEFIEQSGIRRKNQSFNVNYGSAALENLFNRIYEYAAMAKGDVELLCSGFNMKALMKHLSEDFNKLHIGRMASFNNKVLFKTLIAESDADPDKVSYSQYRKLQDDYFYGTPFYVFGETLAIVSWDDPIQVIIIQNKNISEVYRRQFNAMWKMASPLQEQT